MKFTPEEVRYTSGPEIYWVRINVVDTDGNEAKILAGTSIIYLSDHFRLASRSDISDEHIKQWLEEVLSALEKEIRKISSGSVYYHADSSYHSGKVKILKFLQEVAP